MTDMEFRNHMWTLLCKRYPDASRATVVALPGQYVRILVRYGSITKDMTPTTCRMHRTKRRRSYFYCDNCGTNRYYKFGKLPNFCQDCGCKVEK
jgi:hypothetical protein